VEQIDDDELRQIAGRRDRLGAQIEEAYGISKGEAERQVRSFEASNITYKGAIKARTFARITSAEADYMIAKSECGTKAGREKDLCLRDAEAKQARTIGDAIANREAVEARTQACHNSLEGEIGRQIGAARSDS
jgi:hypothetical protein